MEEEFESSFEEVYEKVCNEYKQKLEDSKAIHKKSLMTIIILAAIINLIIVIFPQLRYLIGLTLSLSVCVFLLCLVTGNNEYRKLYKDCVIRGLANGYSEKIYYDRDHGITRLDYGLSHFEENFDKYYAYDRIYGTLENGDNFQMSSIVTSTISRTKDLNGHSQEHESVNYRGIYGIIRLNKNIVSKIDILCDSSLKRFSKNRVEVDSVEFEKYFDCFTKDKVLAMRIFTSELVEKFVYIAKMYKYVFELKIVDNMLFFRYKCGTMFEPPKFAVGLDKELLKKYYRIIYFPMELIKATVDNLTTVVEENQK